MPTLSLFQYASGDWISGFGFVNRHRRKQDPSRHVGATGCLSVGRCSSLFYSPALLYLSCRAVGFPRRPRAGILNSGSPMSPVSGAPHYDIAIHEHFLPRSRGRALIHRIGSVHHEVPYRRKMPCALVSGAAGSYAPSGKARSHVRGQCNQPQPEPEVVCNKNHFGKDMVRARSRSPVVSSRPIRGGTGTERTDIGGSCRSRARAEFSLRLADTCLSRPLSGKVRGFGPLWKGPEPPG